MTTTNPALRPSAPTPSPRPSAPMPPSPKPPANAPKTTTRCIASPPCSRIWPPSASTTSNPPTTCRHSSNSPPSPRCNGEPSNSSASLTASVTRRQYTHSNTSKPQVTPHTSPSQGELRASDPRNPADLVKQYVRPRNDRTVRVGSRPKARASSELGCGITIGQSRSQLHQIARGADV